MNSDAKKMFVFMLTPFMVLLLIFFIGSLFNRVTIDNATQRFVEITKINQNDIQILRHSNMAYVFGNPHDVTFELKIKGRNVSARCTSGCFSPMVCRIYQGDE